MRFFGVPGVGSNVVSFMRWMKESDGSDKSVWVEKSSSGFEPVEENREMLISRSVAYLNVDSAVYGAGFYVSATPQLDPLLVEASKLV